MQMRKGTIKRPKGARGAMIRLRGRAEPESDKTADVQEPPPRKTWETIFTEIYQGVTRSAKRK